MADEGFDRLLAGWWRGLLTGTVQHTRLSLEATLCIVQS